MRAWRDPAGVELVAVSKTVPVDQLREAVAAGLTTLGENRVQELVDKAAVLPGVTWHLVGHLQGNKARAALDTGAVIQTIDSLDLARRLDRLVGEAGAAPIVGVRGASAASPAARRAVYLQVNVDDDPAKAGFQAAALTLALPELAGLPHLELMGLMTVGRLAATAEAARPTFVALRDLSETLRAHEPALAGGLSMGMSDDFEVAVEEGATVVRVGRAIFGERPRPG